MREPTKGDYNRRIIKECDGERPKYLSQFWDYHDDNPHVFEWYLKVAIRFQAEHRNRIGVAAITEHLRDNTRIKTIDLEQNLKLRNQLNPYYARFLILVRPSLAEEIELKRLGMPRRYRKGPVTYTHPLKVTDRATLWATGQWPWERNGGNPHRELACYTG